AAATQPGTHRLSTIPGWRAGGDGLIAPIVAADERLGFVALAWGAEPRDDRAELDRLLLEHAAVTIALLITRRHMATEAAIRLKDDLLDGLLLGQLTDVTQVRERAHALGYDPQRSYRVLVFVTRGLAAL